MMSKNGGSGYTVKEMLSRVMDNQDKANDKWSTEFKRLYDKVDNTTKELKEHDASQDEKIAKIEQKQGIIWKGLAGAISILATAICGLFFKK